MVSRRQFLLVFVVLITFALAYFWSLNNVEKSSVPKVQLSENLPGGEGTVSIVPFPSFEKPSANLAKAELPHFHAGKALAHQPWVKAPTVTFDRDGLGPIFNARTCLMCHVNGGRSVLPNNEEELINTAFLRLSIPGEDLIHGVIAEPMYGDQLQSQSTSLAHLFRHLKTPGLTHSVPPEGYLQIKWIPVPFTYPDGTQLVLREPNIVLTNLGYGKMHPDTMMGIRNAPPLHGVGLLETIPQAQIAALVDEFDADQNGISGRQNKVWDFEAEKTVPGRFGLKANKASVRLQTAGAFHGDMGISNPVFPKQPCTDKQAQCLNEIDGNDKAGTEIPENQFTMVVNFAKSLAVPVRRNPQDKQVLAGRTLFHQTGCAECHHPSYVTGKDKDFPHLSNQTIWPYTDLLIHDMGEGLADGRPDYLASGSEWRTAPLWGVGLSGQVNGGANFLHDGRAKTIEEAILWHGGEAEKTKQQFTQLSKEDRQKLIKFVESL